MSVDDLGQWYYLIYLLPFGLSLVMVLASAFGTSHRGGMRTGHGAGRTGMRAGHGGGRGAGARSHTGGRPVSRPGATRSSQNRSDSHADVTRHDTVAHHGSAYVHHDLPHSVLGFFGIGRVPGVMLWQGFGLSWGAIGFYTSRMLEQGGQPPSRFILPALGCAALGGLAGSKLMAAISARLMPSEESFAMGEEELIGLIGTVVFPVSPTMGRVHVYDAYGTLHVESARLGPDDSETLGKGESALLVDYNPKTGFYFVERSPV